MEAAGFELLFKALDVSLDSRKLVLAVLGLALAVIASGLFFLLGGLQDNTIVTPLIGLLGVASFWGITSLATGAIAKMSYENLRANRPFGVRDAVRYAARHLPALLFAPLLLVGVVLLAYALEGALLLLGRLPSVGPLLVGLLFLPLVLVNMFLLAFVFFGAWLAPAIIAGEGTGPLQTVARARALIQQAPGRILTHLTITVLLMVIMGIALFFLVSTAVSQTITLTGLSQVGARPASGLGSSLFGSGRSLEFLILQLLLSGGLGGFGGFDLLGGGLATWLYLLSLLLLGMAVVAIPYFIFPLSCACAIHMNIVGGKAAQPPTPRVAPAPAQMAPAVSPPVPAPAAAGARTGGRYCHQCGQPLRQGATFCGACGVQAAP